MMLENGISSRERKVLEQAKWDMLRSDIYIRDKGVCWICNEKVELKDYDLGHLIDRCNGGQNEYDNLAVMHKICNHRKPRHTSLEEALKWRSYSKEPAILPIIQPLSFQPLSERQKTLIKTAVDTIGQISTQKEPISRQSIGRGRGIHKLHLAKTDEPAVRELVIEYFKNNPNLLVGNLNHDRSNAIRQLSDKLNTPIPYIRRWLVEAAFVKPRTMATDGSQYQYVYNNLLILLGKYNKLHSCSFLERPKLMGITMYQIDIMFYLINMPEKVSRSNLPKIRKRVAQLGIPIQSIS